MEDRLQQFWSKLPNSRLLSPWQTSRRFPELTYVREDLVGSFKARKYLSLLPWLVQQKFSKVRLEGSSHSSNLLQLGLLLRQSGIEPVYTLEGREGPPVGNGLLNRLVLGKGYGVSSTDKADWTVPEGGNCTQSLAGSLGIAGSLVEQSLTGGSFPERVFVDSGTGFTAAALILGIGYFQLPCQLCVVSMTGQTRLQLDALIAEIAPEFEQLLGVPANPAPYRLEYPVIGPSFGSIPSGVFEEIHSFAQQEGILVDPLYTAKLSLAYQTLRYPIAPTLMFVSGGHRDLLGFQGPLQHWLSSRGAVGG
jgi:1-aminocyclopropane-1-carboxylate deaminase